MKSSTLLFFALLIFFTANASMVFRPVPASTKEQLRILQMKNFANLRARDYQKLTGKKLNLLHRFEWNLSQKRIKNMLAKSDDGEVTTLQKISWLLKGILLGPIALLLGYLLFKGDQREIIKWIWFGFAGWVVWVGLVLLIAA